LIAPALRLVRAAERTDLIDVLAARHHGRAGLDAVLRDLNRKAEHEIVPASAAVYGFGWNKGDRDTEEWWPQGITTSSDAGDIDVIRGRWIVVVAWYAKKVRNRPSRGTRLSFVDVTRAEAPRYRHVMLTNPVQDMATGEVTMQPVRIHAGGIVWYGRTMLVADTHGGLRSFGLDDILRIKGSGYDGYRYVLPQRTSYRSHSGEGVEPLRFSFVSIDRSGPEHVLIAGEYGKDGQSTRLASFGIDAAGEGLVTTDGEAHPRDVVADGLPHMQGATIVDGTQYISTSRGRFRRGTMWTRRRGERPKEHKATLAVGPEDLTYWRQRDQIWSCSEYPGQRFVYAMPRSAFPS
jgi:hypothetical protein